jgi:adenine-specific DNA-methyltransferase
MNAVAAPEKRQQLGQFFTPALLANFMASLFEKAPDELRLLDAGAGKGILSSEVVRRYCSATRRPQRIALTAYELDAAMIPSLEQSYAQCEAECLRVGIEFKVNIVHSDFIKAVLPLIRGDLFANQQAPFNAAILNPPYRKIQSDSSERLLLRSAGIETSNLYTGFLSIATKLLADQGELVAITPRSFCNGPYFKAFRQQFLEQMSLRRLHLLDSRSMAFREDSVLQENVIIHAVKSTVKPKTVTISSSRGIPDGDMLTRSHVYPEIVAPDDPAQFIHLVTDDAQQTARRSVQQHSTSLSSLGIDVSTGRVVDFRARDYLLRDAQGSSYPLIYPCHLRDGFVHWPAEKCRKPQAIQDLEPTQELLIESGIYVLVKRFTSKEERRRIVACIYDPKRIISGKVAFENHLNYFHAHGKGLPEKLAKGLAAYLNSSAVDSYFRQFNGHTQVNATDLRSLPYPRREQLETLGGRIGDIFPDQGALDRLFTALSF